MCATHLSLNTELDHFTRCKFGELKSIPTQSDSCDVGLGVFTSLSQSTSTSSEARSAERNELVSFASSEKTRGARRAWRRARNSSCDTGEDVAGELEEATLEESSFEVCTDDETHSQSSNELVSFVSSELIRGTRSAWQRARNSSCDAGGCCASQRSSNS